MKFLLTSNYSSVAPHSSVTLIPLSNPLAVLIWAIKKTKTKKKPTSNEANIAFPSAPCHSLK
jgi:hypothetical protein